MLKPEAQLLLLQLIDANGGQIHRGDLQETLQELVKSRAVKVHFPAAQPRTIADHTHYFYKLDDHGKEQVREAKEIVKRRQAAKVVKEIKHKKDRATVIVYQGRRYALERTGIAVNSHKDKQKGATE